MTTLIKYTTSSVCRTLRKEQKSIIIHATTTIYMELIHTKEMFPKGLHRAFEVCERIFDVVGKVRLSKLSLDPMHCHFRLAPPCPISKGCVKSQIFKKSPSKMIILRIVLVLLIALLVSCVNYSSHLLLQVFQVFNSEIC